MIKRELVKGDCGAIFPIKSIEVLILNLDNRIMQLQTLALNPTADEATVKDLGCQQTGLDDEECQACRVGTVDRGHSRPDSPPWAQGRGPRASGWPDALLPAGIIPSGRKKPILCQIVGWDFLAQPL